MTHDEAEDDGWWDVDLVTLLLVAGVVLLLLPEPASSGLGVLLIVIGGITWLYTWYM